MEQGTRPATIPVEELNKAAARARFAARILGEAIAGPARESLRRISAALPPHKKGAPGE
jgi:hypothetical protein